MYARVTQLEIDAVRTSVPAALKMFEDTVVPALTTQSGYAGVMAMVTTEGKGIVATFWDTEQQADASQTSGFYADVLSRFATVFRSPPGRERYEVVFAEFPAFAQR